METPSAGSTRLQTETPSVFLFATENFENVVREWKMFPCAINWDQLPAPELHSSCFPEQKGLGKQKGKCWKISAGLAASVRREKR